MSQRINLNTTPNQFMPILYFSQGDIGRTFEIALTSSDGYSIPIGATVEMVATKPSGFGFTVSGSLTGNVATFVTTETMTSEWGRFPAEIVIKNNGDVIGTANFYLNGERNPHPEGTIDGDASTIIPQLTLLVERVETAASSVLDRQTVTQTLPAGSQASYSFDEETNTQTFGIPQGEAGAGAVDVTASAYSSSKTYAVGDYVIHNDYLYRCTTAITTAEAFTAAHWTQVLLGDEVSDVKSALGANYEWSIMRRYAFTLSSSGTYSTASAGNCCVAIPVNGGEDITIKPNTTANFIHIAFLKSFNPSNGSSADFCTGETGRRELAQQTYKLTTPSDCKFIYALAESVNRDLKPDVFLIGTYSVVESVSDQLFPTVIEANNTKEIVEESVIGKTKSLSNLRKYNFVLGSSGNWSANSLIESTALPVNGGEIIQIRPKASASYVHIAYLKTFNPIDGQAADFCTGETGRREIAINGYKGLIPDDCNFVYVLMLNSGTDCSPDSMRINEYDYTLTLDENLRMKWHGKKWACIGDSLTASPMYATKRYFHYVADATGITTINAASSGAGYANEGYAGNFYDLAYSVATDADVYTFFGSFNDYAFSQAESIPIGNASDSGTSSLCGYINSAIDVLIARAPLANIGIVSPCPWSSMNDINAGTFARNYTNALKAICERRSIPFLNLYDCSGLRPWDATFRTLAYTNDSDGVHPDNTGHRIMASKFEAFLNTLLQ